MRTRKPEAEALQNHVTPMRCGQNEAKSDLTGSDSINMSTLGCVCVGGGGDPGEGLSKLVNC